MDARSWVNRLGELLARLAGAAVLGGVSVLLGWVTVMVLLAPTGGANLVSLIALKAFMLLLVGTISLGFGAGALLTLGLRLPDGGKPSAPGALLAFCPGCGGPTAAADERCGACGLALAQRPWLWSAPGRANLSDLLGAPIMLGIASLGVFALSEAVAGDEPVGLRVVLGLLSLLLLGVGGLGSLGVLLQLRDAVSKRGAFSYYQTVHEGLAVRHVQASASVRRGKVRGASGHSLSRMPLPGREAGPRADLSPAERGLVRVLAALQRGERLSLFTERALRWSGLAERARWSADGDGSYRAAAAEPQPQTDVVPGVRLAFSSSEEEASGAESEALAWLGEHGAHSSAEELFACVRGDADAASGLLQLALASELRSPDDAWLEADEAALAAALAPARG